MATKKKT
jgi:hypothetical protein